jgi:WD40 repeat protein
VAFSPNGQQIASVDMDGNFTVRDARTAQVLHTLERQEQPNRARLVRGLAYSPDSRYLALARQDGVVPLWNATNGQPMQTITGHKGPVWQVAFSPDNQTLISGGSDGVVRLWDVVSGKELQRFEGHPAPVKGVAFRADGQSVLAACDDGTVKVWDRGTGLEKFSFRGELANPWVARFSPDARRLGWACMDGIVKVWDTTTGKLQIDKQTNTGQCRAIVFHPDSKRIAVAGFDGTLRLLDATSGREMMTIFAHPHPVADAAFSHDGNKLVSGSYDHTMRVWDATRLPAGGPISAHCVSLETGHQEAVSSVCFSPNGRWLASSSWDGTVKVWECGGTDFQSVRHSPDGLEIRPTTASTPAGYILRYTLRGHSSRIMGVAFSPDNRTLASGSWDKTVKVWDLQAPVGDSLTAVQTIPTKERVASIAFSTDGRLLAVGQGTGLALYDPATGSEAAPFKWTPAPVPAVAFDPVSGRLASAGASDPAIRVWEPASDKPLFEIRNYANSNSSVAFSPDGKLIASQGRGETAGEPTLTVWDVETREVQHILTGHAHYVWKVAFSPDGQHLASGSWDSTIKIWDLKNPSVEPVTLRGHAGVIHGLAFNHDGSRLASGSGYAGHGEVKVWDAELWQGDRVSQ